jgi:hypothetical protein
MGVHEPPSGELKLRLTEAAMVPERPALWGDERMTEVGGVGDVEQ